MLTPTPASPTPAPAAPRIWVFDAAQRDGAEPKLLGTSTAARGVSAQAASAVDAVHGALAWYAGNRAGRSGLEQATNAASALHPETHDGIALIINANDGNRGHTGSWMNGALSLGSGGTYRIARNGTRIEVNVGDNAGSTDVITHELGHAVLEAETGRPAHELRMSGQPRATHEAFGDVLSSLHRRDWTKGGDRIQPNAQNIRYFQDAANPDNPQAATRPIADMHEWDAESARTGGIMEPHIASGVISHTVAEIQKRIGWDDASRLVFGSLAKERLGKLEFADVSSALATAAHDTFGADDPRSLAVRDVLASQGLAPVRPIAS